jgi:hypothetical protein
MMQVAAPNAIPTGATTTASLNTLTTIAGAARLEGFRVALEKMMTDHHRAVGHSGPEIKIELMKGRSYIRVVRCDSQRSAYAFLDMQSGKILKPDGWKGPAKHARGSIWADDFGMSCCTPYSVAYLG